MATAHKVTNKGFSEWQVDQALAFAKESIDSRFCPGYAMKNPTLVGILMQMQMNLEMRLDAQDLQNEVEQSVDEVEQPVIEKDSLTKYEMTLKILKDNFPNSVFSAKQAFDTIRPYRWNSTVSNFKDETTFRGTILRELQVLEKKGVLSFVDGRGTYRLI